MKLICCRTMTRPSPSSHVASKVYKIGDEIGDEAGKEAYVIGKTGDGRWAGLKTTVVET